jgi:hypothetical protein
MPSSSPLLAGAHPVDRIRPSLVAFWALGAVLLGSLVALTVVFIGQTLTG